MAHTSKLLTVSESERTKHRVKMQSSVYGQYVACNAISFWLQPLKAKMGCISFASEHILIFFFLMLKAVLLKLWLVSHTWMRYSSSRSVVSDSKQNEDLHCTQPPICRYTKITKLWNIKLTSSYKKNHKTEFRLWQKTVLVIPHRTAIDIFWEVFPGFTY